MASRRRQKDQRKQERALREHGFDALKRDIERSFPLSEVRVNPSGQEKMSEVLAQFVEPYLGAVSTDDGLRKLYSVGVIAWNLALMPPDERKETLEANLLTALPDALGEDLDVLRSMLDELVDRKNTLFAENRRFIVSFELTARDGRPFLQVASSV